MTVKLKDIYVFQDIDIEAIKMIIDNSRRVDYIEWDTVLHQWADSDNTAYIIQEWQVKVVKDWEEIAQIDEWNIFWEIALITNEPRTATIIAETDLILLKMDKELLHTIIKEFKNWKQIQQVMLQRIKDNIK